MSDELPKTFAEIAKELGVSKPRAFQIYQEALEKLRKKLGVGEQYDLDDFNKAASRFQIPEIFAAKRAGRKTEFDARLHSGETESLTDYTPPQHRDYNMEDTFVVSGPLGETAKYPGRRFPNASAARAYWSAKSTIREEIMVIPCRWIFRVDKPRV